MFYTDNLTAEQLIRYIASDRIELSQEKIENQRNWHIKLCKSWIIKNANRNSGVIFKDDF